MRDCRSLRGLRLGLDIAKVVLPTRRTFHSFAGGGVVTVSINPPQSPHGLLGREELYRKLGPRAFPGHT
ncbi:MAG: hypothetical protein ACYDA9_14595 [Terriglobia bacterium]